MSPPEVVRKTPFPHVADAIERPLLYSGPMVVAVLRVNDPKTQTRRCVTRLAGFGQITEFGRSDTPGYDWHFRDGAMRWHDITHTRLLECCPYGLPGDRLWVREAWAPKAIDPECTTVAYRATDDECNGPWKPSIHMPRWASRISLEITDVRVERLQDISEADARAEGARECDPVSGREVILAGASQRGSFVLHYRDIWEQINGAGSWAVNPWVWVVEFKRIRP